MKKIFSIGLMLVIASALYSAPAFAGGDCPYNLDRYANSTYNPSGGSGGAGTPADSTK